MFSLESTKYVLSWQNFLHLYNGISKMDLQDWLDANSQFLSYDRFAMANIFIANFQVLFYVRTCTSLFKTADSGCGFEILGNISFWQEHCHKLLYLSFVVRAQSLCFTRCLFINLPE